MHFHLYLIQTVNASLCQICAKFDIFTIQSNENLKIFIGVVCAVILNGEYSKYYDVTKDNNFIK